MSRVENSNHANSCATSLFAKYPFTSLALEKIPAQASCYNSHVSKTVPLFAEKEFTVLAEGTNSENFQESTTPITTVALEKIAPKSVSSDFGKTNRNSSLDSSAVKTDATTNDQTQALSDSAEVVIPTENSPEINQELLSLLQQEVPELTEMLGKKTDWLDAIYMLFELMKLNIEGKTQERLFRISERKVQLEQIDEVVKNLEKTAKDQFSAGLMGGLTGIFSGLVPMVGYTKIGESCLGALQSSFNSFKGLKAIDGFEKLGKMLQSMSQMEQGMMDVRKTNAEAARHRSSQFTEITRSYVDDSASNEQRRNQDHEATLQAILQYLNQNREAVTSLFGN